MHRRSAAFHLVCLLSTYRTKGVPNFASLVYLPRPRVRAYSPLFTLRCSLRLLPSPRSSPSFPRRGSSREMEASLPATEPGATQDGTGTTLPVLAVLKSGLSKELTRKEFKLYQSGKILIKGQWPYRPAAMGVIKENHSVQ